MILRPLLAFAALLAAAPAERPVLDERFEQGGGAVARRLLRDPHLSIATGAGVGGGDALRAAYVGGAMGSERIVHSIPLGEAGTDYTLSYDVRFDPDFPFVEGGKLHGLGPERPVAGGNPIRPDGWSARVMWRAKGRAELYSYHQDQRDQYGDHGVVVAPGDFTPGRWQAVSLHVRLNDPATAANGLVELFVDGRLVEQQEAIRLRGSDVPRARISLFLFSTFHGGNAPEWAPRDAQGGYATVHALFDNIAVERGRHIRRTPDG
ncbi:hypothetical protein ASG37_14640 [Sphingomonas sp. Leaf407]|uniref:polysaccharide lyase n=1 Tax=unclassified Sphingomonas TaxID=196159 RepID=UPI0006F243F8|nr:MULTISPECIES: hypothetical protein [unclassified Sphingomonas]KQN35575.1 hypothetical protein ASE97_13895 [Sphingomonas sp. Leaf42]KQT26442.1 hypothetical protein ASG37_14640 [Sphingomonas sp. Leaf407]